ncbi:hypothetical protein ACVQ9Z_05335 [Staphylococcus aureus]
METTIQAPFDGDINK